jgi:hypothetical protein
MGVGIDRSGNPILDQPAPAQLPLGGRQRALVNASCLATATTALAAANRDAGSFAAWIRCAV